MKSLVQHISHVKTLHSLNEFISESFNFRINRDSAKNHYSPKTKDELKQIIKDHYANDIYNLNDIDVSQITDFSSLFFEDKNTGNSEFDISKWNVSKGKNFSNMFDDCKEFNCDLSRWDVNNGSYFTGMFCNCEKFNCDLSQWDVSKGNYFAGMFLKCKEFNSNLSNWNVGMGENFRYMFAECIKFNSDLSHWNVSKGEDFSDMFKDCPIKSEFKPKHEKIY